MSEVPHSTSEQPQHPTVVNPIGELVRFAEKLIDQGEFAQAVEYLDDAHGLHPENQYIVAVLQRAQSLIAKQNTRITDSQRRYMSLTVGGQFDHGVKPQEAGSQHALETRVRRLTVVAGRLFDRGAFDAAFESLMEAYLLDPASPYVVACEQKMKPFWEMLQKRGVAPYRPTVRPEEPESHETSLHPREAPPPPPPPVAEPAPEAKNGSADRLEERKRQLEQQRQEREQTMWRNASGPPRILWTPKAPGSTPPAPKPKPRLRDLDKYDSPRIFRWLKGE